MSVGGRRLEVAFCLFNTLDGENFGATWGDLPLAPQFQSTPEVAFSHPGLAWLSRGTKNRRAAEGIFCGKEKRGLEFSCARVSFCALFSLLIFTFRVYTLGAFYIPFGLNALMADTRRLHA